MRVCKVVEVGGHKPKTALQLGGSGSGIYFYCGKTRKCARDCSMRKNTSNVYKAKGDSPIYLRNVVVELQTAPPEVVAILGSRSYPPSSLRDEEVRSKGGGKYAPQGA